MTSKTFFKSKTKKKQVLLLIPLLQDVANVRTQREMERLVTKMSKKELSFLAECVYNVLYNHQSLLSIDQNTYLQYLSRFAWRGVNPNLNLHKKD